jgi:hypothetical protein
MGNCVKPKCRAGVERSGQMADCRHYCVAAQLDQARRQKRFDWPGFFSDVLHAVKQCLTM